MNDLIDRQAAIDAMDVLCQEHRYRIPGKRETYSQYNEAWQDALDRAENAIFNLPSVQPDWGKPVGDGRPLADGEIIARLQDIKKQIGGSYAIDRAIEVLKALPSAQPEPSQVARDIVALIENEQDMRVILKSAQPEQQWIPCSEGLPKYGHTVLIMNDKGNVSYGRFRGVEFWKDDGDNFWTWKKNTIEHVLAWMPLPEPYKGGQE